MNVSFPNHHGSCRRAVRRVSADGDAQRTQTHSRVRTGTRRREDVDAVWASRCCQGLQAVILGSRLGGNLEPTYGIVARIGVNVAPVDDIAYGLPQGEAGPRAADPYSERMAGEGRSHGGWWAGGYDVPNRILKESICTSDTIEKLAAPATAETFFYRLLVNCDDYGLMDARPAVLRARTYPLRSDSIDLETIKGWLRDLEAAGLITGYMINGQPYLQISTWAKHQQVRTQRTKYPPPEDGEPFSFAEAAESAACNQMKSIASNCALNPNPIRIQSESNPNPNPNPDPNPIGGAARAPQARGQAPPEKPARYEAQALWATIKEAHGYEPSNSVERGGWNKAIMLLRQAQVTPDEYPRLYRTYLTMYPNLTGRITPNAIAKSVGVIRAFRPSAVTQGGRPAGNGRQSLAEDFERIDRVAAMVQKGGSFFGEQSGPDHQGPKSRVSRQEGTG